MVSKVIGKATLACVSLPWWALFVPVVIFFSVATTAPARRAYLNETEVAVHFKKKLTATEDREKDKFQEACGHRV